MLLEMLTQALILGVIKDQESGRFLKDCHASVQLKVGSTEPGKYSCGYFCSHVTSFTPIARVSLLIFSFIPMWEHILEEHFG